ncbi:MAG: ABC transporter ATP-binding protein [Rhizobiaceae bacterium]
MASISLKGLTKKFANQIAVAEMDLEIEDGKFVAILGPSGCGKTTTMNMIAGLETPSAGSIRFDGKDVTAIPATKRGVGFVFQNYAIFTHMTVDQNLGFGLDVTRVNKQERDKKVSEMAAFMALEHRLKQKASSLSVNELQKLAIGRSAIVEPSIFLLDEPLSNLDAAFRERMRSELRTLQRRLKQTMVYVTHDQIEAMGLADKIAVMNLGVLQQYATPADIYANPANVFVAKFIGAPSMNIISNEKLNAARFGSNALVGFRPENVSFGKPAKDDVTFAAQVTFVEAVSGRKIVHLDFKGEEVLAVAGRSEYVNEGDGVVAVVSRADCRGFDAASGAALERWQ